MITMLILAIGGVSLRVWSIRSQSTLLIKGVAGRHRSSCRTIILLAAAMWLLPAASAQVADEDNFESVQAVENRRASDVETADVEKAAQQIVAQTNDFRKNEGLEVVEVDSDLEAAAKYFAEFMAREDEYGHTADGQRPSERAKQHGYEYCIIAENIAYQFNSAGFETKELATKFVTGWKNSPEHRDNLLDRDVTETGVAVARSEKTGYYYAVQMFGRPKTAMIEFQIMNESDATVDYTIEDRSFTLPPRYTRTHRRCRPSDVEFQLPDDKTKTVEPTTGDQYTVSMNGQVTIDN